MKMGTSRRQFFKVMMAALVPMLVAAPASAGGYETLSPVMSTSTGDDKVEVLEFFWLGCPHCYSLEPKLEAWLENKPEHAEFVREAPPLNPSWEQHSRGFYAAQILGIEDEFVKAMFEAIHQQKKRMRKPDDIAELAASLGADKKKFLSTMKSFAVNTKMARAIQLAGAANLTGVPAVVINGKYLTTASIAGGQDGMISAIEVTVEREKPGSGS